MKKKKRWQFLKDYFFDSFTPLSFFYPAFRFFTPPSVFFTLPPVFLPRPSVFLPRPPFFYPALRFFTPPSVFLPSPPFFYPALRFFTPPGLLGLCVRTMISQLENVSLVMGEDSDFDAPLFVVLCILHILARTCNSEGRD